MIDLHNKERAYAINGKDPLPKQREIQELCVRIPLFLRQPRSHKQARKRTRDRNNKSVDPDSIRKADLRNKEVEVNRVYNAAYTRLEEEFRITQGEIPVLLPASTIPSASAFLL